MGKVYIEQTDLTLFFEAGKSLNALDTALIEYISPRNAKGTFDGIITDPIKGVVAFNVNKRGSEFLALGAGKYTFWLNITDIVTGLISIGEPCNLEIYTKGK